MRCAQSDLKRCHAFVISESQQFRDETQVLFATVYNFLAGLRVKYVEIAGGLEHANVLFDQKQITLQHLVHRGKSFGFV